MRRIAIAAKITAPAALQYASDVAADLRKRGDLRVRVRARPVSIVMNEEGIVERGEIVEEVEERLATHSAL
jgi:hypothetical protein